MAATCLKCVSIALLCSAIAATVRTPPGFYKSPSLSWLYDGPLEKRGHSLDVLGGYTLGKRAIGFLPFRRMSFDPLDLAGKRQHFDSLAGLALGKRFYAGSSLFPAAWKKMLQYYKDSVYY